MTQPLTIAILVCLALPAPCVEALAPQVRESADSRVFSLSGTDWWIHDDPDGKGVERHLFEANTSSAGWIAGTVPGNIQADLEAAHQLQPLWYGVGDGRMHDAACKDWWYRKDVVVPARFAGKRVTLVFDGVDHECEVFFNGRKVGGNAGMYKRFWFYVSDAIQPGQVNRLAVRIARIPEDLRAAVLSADAPGGVNVANVSNAVRKRLKELKSPTNSAYDWAVAIYTLGIWKDVWLEATGPARLDWVGVNSTLTDHYSNASIRVRLDVDSLAGLPTKLRLSAAQGKSRAQSTVAVKLKAGTNHLEATLSVRDPALWWPAGQGRQPLYELAVELRHADTGELLDRRTIRFGIREIRWEQTPGTRADFINPLKLVVNGRPIRQMGSNLVPPDSLFGRMNARGLRLLDLARAAGINCLRLWGGGVILSEAMYDRADELGMMLLQEFPLANCVPETDSLFLEHLEATAVNIVKQVRNHPSIVEWSGGSELVWKNGDDHPALHALEKVVREEDGRIFRATEAAQGSGAHGTYTYVYHTEPAAYLTWLGAGAQNLYQRYDTSEEMRLSEFGTHSPANLEVWQRTIPPASQWPLTNYDDPVLIRKNVFWGAALKENWLHKEITERLFGPLAGLEQLVPAGQFLGAEGLRYAMDALRRKGPALGGGFMSWDYNEPWPNGAGSYMVDYDGQPLMNYDFVTQALTPVSLTLKYPSLLYDSAKGVSAQLFLASDAPATARNLHWHWQARDRRGKVFAHGNGVADSITPQGVLPLESITLRPPPETALGPVFVELGLQDADGQTLVERLHVFGAAALQAPLAGLWAKGLQDRDDTEATAEVLDPRNPQNLAWVGNGAAPATATAELPGLEIHRAKGLNDGLYGNAHIETYAPAVESGGELPKIVVGSGLAPRPVTRTAIEAEARPVHIEGGQEVMDLVVRNAGPMTALFCEAHPLIEYRTDLFIRNNHISIPPGQKRSLTIRSATRPAGGLSLAQTGWRITTWNADERVIEPAPSVLLALGRRDAMCREFAGYSDAGKDARAGQDFITGSRPDPSQVPCLLNGKNAVRFQFTLGGGQVKRPARLRLHTADQAEKASTRVGVTINGRRMEGSLPVGLGIQQTDPSHLAFPATVEFQIPARNLRLGKNTLEVRVEGDGWYTWDAMDFTSVAGSDRPGP